MKLLKNQKTTPAKGNIVDPKWLIVDVKDGHVGHVATQIANLLRGKNKVFFTPQYECGDHVVVLNAKHVKLTGTKLDKKLYLWHTQYSGGLRSRTAREMLNRNPEKVLRLAVYGMLPKNRLRDRFMKKLHIFAELDHAHIAQQPQETALTV